MDLKELSLIGWLIVVSGALLISCLAFWEDIKKWWERKLFANFLRHILD